jgi:hypothetical protein
LLQSRLAQSLRGSLRTSAIPLANSSRDIARTLSRHSKRIVSGNRNLDIVTEDWIDDFEHISYDEQLAPPLLIHTEEAAGTALNKNNVSTQIHQTPSPSHSVFSRLKNLSRASVHQGSPRQLSSRSKQEPELTNLVLDFPKPPSHIPTPIASAHSVSTTPPVTETAPIDDRFSVLFHPDTFRFESILEQEPAELQYPAGEAEAAVAPIPLTRASTPSPPPSIADTDKGSIFPESLRRFKSLTKTILRTSKVSWPYSTRAKGTRLWRGTTAFSDTSPSSNNSLPLITLEPLPQITLRNSDLTPSSPKPPLIFQRTGSAAHSVDLSLLVEPKDQAPAEQYIQSNTYERVDPLGLTASPPPLLNGDLLSVSARTSFIPPSPSWLSRNVQGLDLLDLSGFPEVSPVVKLELLFPPSSPLPIPIPPRITNTPLAPCTLPLLEITDVSSSSEHNFDLESNPPSPVTSPSASIPASLVSSTNSSSSYITSPDRTTVARYTRGAQKTNSQTSGRENQSFLIHSPKVRKFCSNYLRSSDVF